ncbi:hypothetical protein TB1_010038 [Malus domestica]
MESKSRELFEIEILVKENRREVIVYMASDSRTTASLNDTETMTCHETKKVRLILKDPHVLVALAGDLGHAVEVIDELEPEAQLPGWTNDCLVWVLRSDCNAFVIRTNTIEGERNWVMIISSAALSSDCAENKLCFKPYLKLVYKVVVALVHPLGLIR